MSLMTCLFWQVLLTLIMVQMIFSAPLLMDNAPLKDM